MRALLTSKGESVGKAAICFENQGHFHRLCDTELLSLGSLTPCHSGLWECSSHQMHVTHSHCVSSQYCRGKTWPEESPVKENRGKNMKVTVSDENIDIKLGRENTQKKSPKHLTPPAVPPPT